MSAPVEEKDEVAVPPKYAVPVFENKVEDAPPVRMRSEVVADCPAAGCVNGSPPPPVPHALAFAETVPSAPTCRQRVHEPPTDDTMRFVVDAVPFTEKSACGSAVPTPTLPALLIRKLVRDEEPTTN